MKPLIEIKNINVDYDLKHGSVDVLRNVSFNINKNDFICILGPSGSGKSTLLKAIAGFLNTSKGQILMDGKEITGPDSSRGVVFQAPNLFPWFSVKNNVTFGPKLANKSKEEIDQIANKFLKQVNLEEYKHSKVFELSGGQKQRVAIARMLANNPEVILMDEPFSALDSFTRKNMRSMIRKIWNENNSTIFFVTHDIDEALLLGTEIYVLKKGENSVVANYDINYTNQLLKNPKAHVYDQKDYIDLKDEILALLEE